MSKETLRWLLETLAESMARGEGLIPKGNQDPEVTRQETSRMLMRWYSEQGPSQEVKDMIFEMSKD